MQHGMGKNNGFTLIELIISMAVLTFGILIVFYAFTSSMRLFSDELTESDVSLETHRAIERMSRELRNSKEIVSSSGTSISFWYQDTNNNGTREAAETVTYTWTGGTVEGITRTIGATSVRLANDIYGLSITYNSPLITIVVTGKKGSSIGTLESSVKSRNL